VLVFARRIECPHEDRFSEVYARPFNAPLLDHNFYRNLLRKHVPLRLVNEQPDKNMGLTVKFPAFTVLPLTLINSHNGGFSYEVIFPGAYSDQHCLCGLWVRYGQLGRTWP